jgi:phosphatidylglycerol---prolipoprotein diacylglyceryl transferase
MQLALIPWFKLEPLSLPIPVLGSIKLQPFGVFAALAILAGSRAAERRAAQRVLRPGEMGGGLGLSREVLSSFLSWTTAVGLVSAYVLNVVMYEPERLVEIAHDPSLLIRRWTGLSSYGGFIGGTLTALVFARWRKLALVPLGDAWCFAMPFAWVLARSGCFVVHDHPGLPSDFFLAVADYDHSGIARHDLGLYEVLWAIPVALLFWWRSQRPARAGYYLGLLPLSYGPVRFALDFLRADKLEGGDARYFALTPAQYLSLLLTLAGVGLCLRYCRQPRPLTQSV